MDTLAELWHFDFLRNAFVAGLLSSMVCGVLGTFVVVRRLVFISGGISHAAFGGLGICYFLGWPPLLGAFIVAILTATVLGSEADDKPRGNDAAIGVLWALGMALGIVFIYKTPGYAPNLMSYLFGDILTVTATDLVLLAVLTLAVWIVMVLLYKELVAVSFDAAFARIQGVPVRGLQTLLLLLVGSAIVVLIQVVGIVLVIALLTVPTLTAMMLVRRFIAVMAVSVLASLSMVMIGLLASYFFDIPSGPAIVLCGVALMAGAWTVRHARRSAARHAAH